MDISQLNLDSIKKYTNIKINIDLSRVRESYRNFRSRFQKPILLPGFKMIIGLAILAIVLPILYKNTLVRTPLSGTLVGSYIFCWGKPLCADARCVGETFRECKVCPSGTARSVAKATCDENLYSACKFDDNKCIDRGVFNF
jgi:hypothetical protein